MTPLLIPVSFVTAALCARWVLFRWCGGGPVPATPERAHVKPTGPIFATPTMQRGSRIVPRREVVVETDQLPEGQEIVIDILRGRIARDCAKTERLAVLPGGAMFRNLREHPCEEHPATVRPAGDVVPRCVICGTLVPDD